MHVFGVHRIAAKLLLRVLIQHYTEYSRVYYKLYRQALSLEGESWLRIPSKRTKIARGAIDRNLSRRMGCKGFPYRINRGMVVWWLFAAQGWPRVSPVRVSTRLNICPGSPDSCSSQKRNISSLNIDKNRILLISFKATQSIQFLPIP